MHCITGPNFYKSLPGVDTSTNHEIYQMDFQHEVFDATRQTPKPDFHQLAKQPHRRRDLGTTAPAESNVSVLICRGRSERRNRLFQLGFVMLRIVLAATFFFAPVVGARAQQKTPKFTDYPASEQLYQRHPLVLTSKDQNYRTNLKAASIAKANFAGHFVLTIWGCGSVCAEGALIDLTNGKVVWLPGLSVGRPDSVERGIDGRLNSKLLILAGSLADGEGYPPAMHYYKIEDDKFIHITNLPLPAP